MIYLEIWGFHHTARQWLWEQRQQCKARSSKRSPGVQRLKSICFLWWIYNQTIKKGKMRWDQHVVTLLNFLVEMYVCFIIKLIMRLSTSKLNFSASALIFTVTIWTCLKSFTTRCTAYILPHRILGVVKNKWVQMLSMLHGLNTTKNHNSNHHQQSKYSSPRKGSVPMGSEHKSIWLFLPIASDLISI